MALLCNFYFGSLGQNPRRLHGSSKNEIIRVFLQAIATHHSGGRMLDPHSMNILIVDDMESMCKAIRSMLKILHMGGQIYYAYNGQEAWNLLKSDAQIDMAILDWNMPIMTGVELLGHIRDDRQLRDMPVVMVTAEANQEIVAEAAESEIDAYILKPVTVKSLEERIKSVIGKANNPPPMLMHLKNARIFEEKGQLVEAVREAMRAMEANPKSSRPIRELGHLYHKQGDIAQAEKYYLKAARMNPMDVFAFHSLGDLALQRGDMDKAAQHYEQAVRISPRNLERGLNFGKVLLEKDMTDRAVKVFDKILDLADDPISVREEIATLCASKGAHAYAIELYGCILKQMPGRHDIMAKLVDAYDRAGESRKAMPYLLELEKNTEKDTGLLLKIARIYLSIHQNARADQILQKVMKIEPGNREAKELIAQCL